MVRTQPAVAGLCALVAALNLGGCLKPVDLTGPGFQCTSDAECEGFGPCARGICGGSCVAPVPQCPLSSQVCDAFGADAGPFTFPGWTLRVDSDSGTPPIVGRIDKKACNHTSSAYVALEDGRQAQLERTLDAGLKEIFVRAFLYLPSTLKPRTELDLVNVQFGAVVTRFGLSGADGGLFVTVGDGGAVPLGPLPRERWFCFQGSVLDLGSDGGPGLVRTWVDGAPVSSIDAFTTDPVLRRTLQIVDVGLRSDLPQPSMSLWLDNVAIAASDVGCD